MLVQTDQSRKINVTIIVLARFGLRDGSLATTVIADFNRILKFKYIDQSILCTLITAFADLCKRYVCIAFGSLNIIYLIFFCVLLYFSDTRLWWTLPFQQ